MVLHMKPISYYVDFENRSVKFPRVPPALEQRAVLDYFHGCSRGFFVDVGANDPTINSQSFHLEQAGWTGILVEPLPAYCALLRQRRTSVVVECACSSRANHGQKLAIQVAGTHSTLETQLMDRSGRVEPTRLVNVRTLDSVLRDHNVERGFELLSIDVEGHELELFDGLDIEYWNPRLMLLEDHVLDHSKHNYMTRHGYKLLLRTGLNSWYIPIGERFTFSWRTRIEFVRKYWLNLLPRRFKFRRANA